MRFFDLHIDTLEKALAPGVDLLAGTDAATVDLPRLEESGAYGAVWAACDSVHLAGAASAGYALRMIAAGRDLAARAGGRIRLVRGAADLEDDAARPGGHRMILAVEGAHSLAGSLEMLAAFHALGVRLLTLTWNHANPFASGCRTPAREDHGVTPLGCELLRRSAELGIVVDLAHASAATFADALPRLHHPPLVSHTACAALHPHPRNLTDEQLKAVARAGGVVGISFIPPFLAAEGASLETVVAHVRHAVAVAGAEAVALGSDFDGVPSLPAGISGVGDMPRLLAALEGAGLTGAELAGLAWRNAVRVLAAGLKGESG